MKATGMIRSVDQLGRVVIPKELRDSYGIHADSSMEIFVDEDCIVLRRYQSGCMFCARIDNLQPVGDKEICPDCAKRYLDLFIQAANK